MKWVPIELRIDVSFWEIVLMKMLLLHFSRKSFKASKRHYFSRKFSRKCYSTDTSNSIFDHKRRKFPLWHFCLSFNFTRSTCCAINKGSWFLPKSSCSCARNLPASQCDENIIACVLRRSCEACRKQLQLRFHCYGFQICLILYSYERKFLERYWVTNSKSLRRSPPQFIWFSSYYTRKLWGLEKYFN